ncbi:MAG: PadR family transcriptional regulator [Bacteroidota bacterium]
MSNLSLSGFEELVLLAVAAQHKQAYGVSIKESLEQQLDKKVNLSAVHVTLKRMSEKGFVRSEFGGITKERGGRRKKFYIISASGKAALDKQYEIRTHMYRQIPKLSFD